MVGSAPGTGLTVLLVEDQEAVRTLLRMTLTRKGFRVLVAGSGEEAVKAAGGPQTPIHLLISDVHLPGMNGPEVARQLRAVYPEMKLLFLSGYGNESCGAWAGDAHFLQKPFQLDVLVQKVRSILQPEPAPSHP